jgi:hypothetical protein
LHDCAVSVISANTIKIAVIFLLVFIIIQVFVFKK